MYICKLFNIVTNTIIDFQILICTYIIFEFTIGFTEYTFVICMRYYIMEEVANRIQQIIKSRGISNSEMADSIGLPRPILSHILSGRNKPSLAVIQKITETYSDIDVKWLLVGKESQPFITQEKEIQVENVELKQKLQTEDATNTVAPESIEPIQKNEPNTIINPAISSNSNEVTQIVHYFANGTFKVFTPNA